MAELLIASLAKISGGYMLAAADLTFFFLMFFSTLAYHCKDTSCYTCKLCLLCISRNL